MTTTRLACKCGTVQVEVTGAPFLSTECCCTSCRAAGARMAHLPRAPAVLTEYGATPSAMYRKDRVRVVAGADRLRAFRLKPESQTRRAVATCCNTPVFLEFTKGHWIDLYKTMWPDGDFPAPVMRTMAGDLPDAAALPGDIPNHRSHNLGFFARLLGAWVAMGFRTPRIDIKEDAIA